MTTMTFKLCRGALVAAALVSAPIVLAGPSPGSPEMQTALAKADQSPDELRRYINRTRMIYALNFNEVMLVQEAIKAAQTEAATTVAKVPVR